MSLLNRWYNYRTSQLPDYYRCINWVKEHMTPDGAVMISDKIQQPYPEVTGYLIPSLLNFGHFELCDRMSTYLRFAQQGNGAWLGSNGVPSAFDTGQVLKGLLAIRKRYSYIWGDPLPTLDETIRTGCEYLVSQINDGGMVNVADPAIFNVEGYDPTPNEVHVYAMQPLIDAAGIFKETEWSERANLVIKRAMLYASNNHDHIFPHFAMYIAEGLFDCGYGEHGYRFLRWIDNYECIPAQYQAAVFSYKYWKDVLTPQWYAEQQFLNPNGLFEGSTCGVYFPHDELSWSVKFWLDAFYWRCRTSPTVSVEPLDMFDSRLTSLLVDPHIKSGLILDAGCGTGRYINKLWKSSNRIIGMDIKGGKYIQGELCNIPFETDHFDAVYCVEALEHAVNQEAAVDEMSRVAKGAVIIIDKFAEINGRMRIAPWERWPQIAEVGNWLSKHWGVVRSERIDNTFVKWVGCND